MVSARVVGYIDRSFANNADMSSQLRQVILLVNKSGNAAPITFKSYTARRVTRSAMSGEIIALSDMFYFAIAISAELSTVLGCQIPTQLLTDSNSLFDIISKGTRTSEKCSMLDIAAARTAFKDKVIFDLGCVQRCKNIADGLTKSISQATLRQVMISDRLDMTPDLWIICKD